MPVAVPTRRRRLLRCASQRRKDDGMPDKQYEITRHTTTAGVTQLRVAGEIDMAVSEELRHVILAAVRGERTAEVLVDLGQVTFLDSSGIAVLVAGQRAAQQAGRRYRVVNPRGVVQRTLDVTGVLTILAGS